MIKFKLFDEHHRPGQKSLTIPWNDGSKLTVVVDQEGWFELPDIPTSFPIHAIAKIED